MIGLMLVFTLYLQLGQGFSAIGAGLALVPWSLGTAIGARAGAAVLGPKLGRPTLHLGLIVMLGGILAMLAVVNHEPNVRAWALAGPELLAGIAVIGTLFFSVAGHHGLTAALEKMLYVEAGTLLVAMGLVFLLPMRARESEH
jgi:hypothetical protein